MRDEHTDSDLSDQARAALSVVADAALIIFTFFYCCVGILIADHGVADPPPP